MKHYIQLVGFDGESYWKMFYVEIRDDEEVYYGFSSKSEAISFSRHGSGVMHRKLSNTKKRTDNILAGFKRKPISEITSGEALGTFCPMMSKEAISEEEYKKCGSKKCNGIFLIDLRNFDGTMNIQPYLINPDNKEFLMQHKFNHKCQLYLYTASSPWVAFYVLNVPPIKEDLNKNE